MVSEIDSLKIQGKVSRATIKSQEAQIARLTAIIESNKLNIISQAAEIELLSTSSRAPPTPCATTSSVSINVTKQAQDNDKVEELERELQRRDDAVKRMDKILGRLRDENEQLAGNATGRKMCPALITCDCSTHYADPLSDASILCFTDDLEEIDSTDTERWTHFKQQYHVPPDVVLENHHFSKSLDVLKGYANMQRYTDEGSTSAKEAAKFFKDSKSLIEKVYPVGVFKCDEDVERNVVADLLYEDLQDIAGAAAIRHRTFVKASATAIGS
ncbi:hypothetical protein BKA61DRAFT_651258 [Leptodontidium sp. MPI-SDFR-AT-0119]|nr:hypothetical protein BKA61DRAFT_651258 [Leptodontidium sp. MPI-SDFR-AT-0119]